MNNEELIKENLLLRRRKLTNMKTHKLTKHSSKEERKLGCK